MAFPGEDWLPAANQSSLATRLISGDIKPGDVYQLAERVNLGTNDDGPGRLKIITAYYDLAQADNRIMIEWLLESGDRAPEDMRRAVMQLLKGKQWHTPDVRYTLANVLHSTAVQQQFDLIIIDCPPRLTTSKIQAFCASSHLLIPTIFDRISAEAVGSLCDQVETLRRADICPHIGYIGVVGTMWRPGRVAQREAITFVRDALAEADIPTDILPEQTFFPHAAALVNNAADGIAYIAMPDSQDLRPLRTAITELTRHIAVQMGIPGVTDFRVAAE
jgi:chromosome partitioning protein